MSIAPVSGISTAASALHAQSQAPVSAAAQTIATGQMAAAQSATASHHPHHRMGDHAGGAPPAATGTGGSSGVNTVA